MEINLFAGAQPALLQHPRRRSVVVAFTLHRRVNLLMIVFINLLLSGLRFNAGLSRPMENNYMG
jgi:hypothetical protein